MLKIQTRTDLLAQIARLKAEKRKLQEAFDEIAEIVNDEDLDDLGPEDEQEEEDYEEEDGE